MRTLLAHGQKKSRPKAAQKLRLTIWLGDRRPEPVVSTSIVCGVTEAGEADQHQRPCGRLRDAGRDIAVQREVRISGDDVAVGVEDLHGVGSRIEVPGRSRAKR